MMPGSEIEGKSLTQHEANLASKQDAVAKFKDNTSDVGPKFQEETIKGHNKDGGAKQTASGNERSDVKSDMGIKNQ